MPNPLLVETEEEVLKTDLGDRNWDLNKVQINLRMEDVVDYYY